MCITRAWKNISATDSGNVLYITAKRSDNVLIQIITNIVNREDSLGKQFSDILKNLESFRNCKCITGKACEQHKAPTELHLGTIMYNSPLKEKGK